MLMQRGRICLAAHRLLGMIFIFAPVGWVDSRVVSYGMGLVSVGFSPGVKKTLMAYTPRASLERALQLFTALSALRTCGVRCVVWGDYRYRWLSRAFIWGGSLGRHLAYGPLPVVHLWVGGRLARRHSWSQPLLALTSTPSLEMVPYSGLPTQVIFFLLWLCSANGVRGHL